MYLIENPVGTHVWINGEEYIIAKELEEWSCAGCDLYHFDNCLSVAREHCSERKDKTGIIFRKVAKLQSCNH